MYHAVRGLLRRPLFTAAAVASLALGLGAITTVFSVVNALLLKPLPYRDAGRLVAIWPAQYFANREIDAFRARARSYEEVASLSPGWLMALTDVTVPRQLNGAKVSGNLFAMLGAEPVVGRRFGMEAELPGEDKVALLSWELWQSSFNGDAGMVGRSIRLDREMYRVIGVMPAAFRPLGASSDLWVPMAMDETAMAWTGATTAAFGRLRPEVTPAMATSELNVLAGQLQKEFSLAPNWTQNVAVVSLKESMVGAVRPTLLILFSAVAFLLLIASANVANLLLVRNAERRHELAVRASLGATPRDLAGFIAAEGAVLGIAGALAGLVVTVGGVALLRRILPAGLPRLEEIGIDLRVVGAAIGFAVIATVAFALAPALQGKSAALAARLRSGRTVAGHGQRTRGLVVSAEIALALILTVGATLMGRTLVALNAVDPGLRADHLLTLRLQPSTATDDALRAYWSTVLERIRGIPGVIAAGTVLHLPASGRKWMGPVEVEGRPLNPGESPVRTAWQSVSPEYLQVAGVPLVSGRPLSSTDGPNDPRVMVVNQAFARTFFAAEDPVGRRVKAGNGTQGQWTTIVGVVGNIRHDSLNVAAGPEIYVPFAQRTVVATALVVRTAGDPLRFAVPVREAVWGVDRNVPISDVRTMDDLLAQSLSRQRMVLILLGLFAGVGLLLSGVGIYGVVAYGVRQRTRELGVRVALGADRAAIRALVLGQGMRYAAAGVLIGLPLALALSRLMRAMVFGVTTSDPASFVGVAMLLVGVALAASWIPARKAAAGDPTAILRD